MAPRHGFPDSIRMKTNIPEDVRTPGKDDAAIYLQNKVVDAGRWPMNIKDIAEECDWSRQHIANVLKDYFEEDQSSESKKQIEPGMGGMGINIPDDVENVSDYLRGVAMGAKLG